MLRIIEILPNGTDGTSFYRGRGPNSLLEKTYRGDFVFLPVNPNATLEWDSLMKCDLVFMQRPIYDVHVNTARLCRRLGIPLWIDYDDLLTAVPPDNEFHGQFEAFKKNVTFMINNADVVSVSTPHLQKKLEEIAPATYIVIPNALHPMFGKPRENLNDGIFWRGSRLHLKDLLDVRHELKAAIEKTELPFTMMGYDPWFFKEIGMKYQYFDYGDLLEYYALLDQRQWNICVVPLYDCDFNRAKSNIAWIEATYAGAMVIAPDFEEWKRPGIFNYTDAEELKARINYYARRPDLVKGRWKESADFINDNLLLKDVNKLRMGIIRTLTKNGTS